MRSKQARGQQIRQVLPEQSVQRRTAFQHVRRTHEQPRCNGVRMSRSLQQIDGSRRVGFTGNACSEPRLIELAYAFEQATKKRVPPASVP